MSAPAAAACAAAAAVLCAAAAFVGPPTHACAQDLAPFDWAEDARWLRVEFAERHANAFHSRSRAAHDSAFDRLIDWIPRLDATGDHAVVVGIARAVNAVGDGHSGVRLFADSAVSFRGLPVRIGAYPEGLFVEAADAGHADLAGARLLRVGALPAETVLELVAPLIARDNDMDVLRFGPTLMVMPEVLHALGVVAGPDSVEITVDDAGERRSVVLAPERGAFRLEGHGLLDTRARRDGWRDALARDAAPGTGGPLLYRDPARPFWSEWLPEERALYVQINRIGDGADATFADFAEGSLADAEARGAERLVLDLRWNRGGNNYLLRPLVRAILKSPFDEEGRLFVLIGRYTFSAAQSLVNELSRLTAPVYLGEPTAAAPNGYGDNRRLVLPNSGITVRASYLWWQQRDPRDERRCTAPHVHAPITFAAYLEGRDPALEAALAWSPGAPGPGAAEVAGALDASGAGVEGEGPGAAGAGDAAGSYESLLCRDGPPRVGEMF